MGICVDYSRSAYVDKYVGAKNLDYITLKLMESVFAIITGRKASILSFCIYFIRLCCDFSHFSFASLLAKTTYFDTKALTSFRY